MSKKESIELSHPCAHVTRDTPRQAQRPPRGCLDDEFLFEG
ncbi:MAG TPA: hypothetical protein VGK20_01010 [Candidatus Binatia bacterium]